MSDAFAGRGRLSIVHGDLEPVQLRWLQSDPCWRDLAAVGESRDRRQKMRRLEHDGIVLAKYEDGGFVGDLPPEQGV